MIQLDSFGAYVPFCPNDDKMRLVVEMEKIAREIEDIKAMGLKELQEQVEEYTDVQESKLTYLIDEETLKIYGKRTA